MPSYLKHALLVSLVYIGLGLLEYYTDSAVPGYLITLLSWVVLGFGMFLSMREKKEELGGFISYGDAFSNGLRFTLVFTIIIAIWAFLDYSYINTEELEEARRTVNQAMEEQEDNEMSEDEQQMFSSIMSNITSPFVMSIIFLVTNFIKGLIVALIVAAIIQRDRPYQQNQVID